jgi:hypothetical protein
LLVGAEPAEPNPWAKTEWLERGMNPVLPQADYQKFITEYFAQQGVALSATVPGMPSVPNPYLYNNGADYMDARHALVSEEQWQADRTSGLNMEIGDFWNANYCALQVPLAQSYSMAVQQEGAPFRAAYEDGQIRGAIMGGREEINEAVPDNPVLDFAGLGWLTSWQRYQYASENSYSQADDYFNQAVSGGVMFVGTAALSELASPFVSAALRPAAWEASGATVELASISPGAGILGLDTVPTGPVSAELEALYLQRASSSVFQAKLWTSNQLAGIAGWPSVSAAEITEALASTEFREASLLTSSVRQTQGGFLVGGSTNGGYFATEVADHELLHIGQYLRNPGINTGFPTGLAHEIVPAFVGSPGIYIGGTTLIGGGFYGVYKLTGGNR